MAACQNPWSGIARPPPLFPRDGAVLLGPFWGPFGTFRDIQNCYMYSMLPYARPNGTAICRDLPLFPAVGPYYCFAYARVLACCHIYYSNIFLSLLHL